MHRCRVFRRAHARCLIPGPKDVRLAVVQLLALLQVTQEAIHQLPAELRGLRRAALRFLHLLLAQAGPLPCRLLSGLHLLRRSSAGQHIPCVVDVPSHAGAGLSGPQLCIRFCVLPADNARASAQRADGSADQSVVQNLRRIKLPVQLSDALVLVDGLRDRGQDIRYHFLDALAGTVGEETKEGPSGIALGKSSDCLLHHFVCSTCTVDLRHAVEHLFGQHLDAALDGSVGHLLSQACAFHPRLSCGRTGRTNEHGCQRAASGNRTDARVEAHLDHVRRDVHTCLPEFAQAKLGALQILLCALSQPVSCRLHPVGPLHAVFLCIGFRQRRGHEVIILDAGIRQLVRQRVQRPRCRAEEVCNAGTIVLRCAGEDVPRPVNLTIAPVPVAGLQVAPLQLLQDLPAPRLRAVGLVRIGDVSAVGVDIVELFQQFITPGPAVGRHLLLREDPVRLRLLRRLLRAPVRRFLRCCIDCRHAVSKLIAIGSLLLGLLIKAVVPPGRRRLNCAGSSGRPCGGFPLLLRFRDRTAEEFSGCISYRSCHQ